MDKGVEKKMSKLDWVMTRLIPKSHFPDYLRKKGVEIGEKCEIYKTASFGSEPYLIKIGNHVRVNSGVVFVTHDGGYWVLRDEKAGFGAEFKEADKFGRIVIEDNVHIGTNAIIMPGVTIGENSVIACGAVVTHDVSPNSVWGGVPARLIESLEEYASKAREHMCSTKSMTPEEKKTYIIGHLTGK